MLVRAICTAAFCLCLFTTSLLASSQATEAKIIAQVGSVPVTVFDVGRERQKLLSVNTIVQNGVPQKTFEQINEEALNTMIDQAYKVNYALDKKINIDKKIIDDRILSLKKKYKTDKEFNAALGEESIKDLRSAIERTLLAGKAEELAVLNNIDVSDAEVRADYDAHKQMYQRPKQFKASHILVKVSSSASGEEELAILEKKAKNLAERAKRGENFYNLAYYNSDDRSKYVGGDLGFFHEGQTISEFEDALKRMKAGEISEPIKSRYGWHIIKLVELNEVRQLEFEEIKVKIRNKLEKAAKDKLASSWMSELKGKYPVKNFNQ